MKKLLVILLMTLCASAMAQRHHGGGNQIFEAVQGLIDGTLQSTLAKRLDYV
jgi:hypothetical protein